MNRFIFTFFLLFLSINIYSTILDDLTQDNELYIIIDLNAPKDSSDDSSSDVINNQNVETTFGNKWFSSQQIYFSNFFRGGMSGSKDFLFENFLFKYSFKSKNKHKFSIRIYHLGYSLGVFSGHFSFFNFNILAGFEYLYKIFNNDAGFFSWADIGGCNGGFSFYTGIGVGSPTKNGFTLSVSFLQNTLVLSNLNFYFLFFDIMTLHGIIGLTTRYSNNYVETFYFKAGLSIGIFVKNKFKLEIGGGFTVNEYSYFNGFGMFTLAGKIPIY